MEVAVSPTYLISIIATSTVLASLLGATLGLFGQVWLEKLKHKHKKEERKEDIKSKEGEDLTVTIQSIIDTLNDAITGLRGIYYDKILYLANRYISEQSITAKELEDLDDLHRVYKNNLNGDGFLDKEMERAHSLPRVRSKPDRREQVEQLLREIMGGGRRASDIINEDSTGSETQP